MSKTDLGKAREPGNVAASDDLEARLSSLEDRLAILDLLAALPHSSDVGDQDFQNHAYHDDCVMDRDNADALVVGKTAIVGIVGGDSHRSAIQAGMVHFAGLPHIQIEGESAVATGYLQVVVPLPAGTGPKLSGYGQSNGLAIWRLTANRWELQKNNGSWRVIRRVIRSVPGEGFQSIIAEGLR